MATEVARWQASMAAEGLEPAAAQRQILSSATGGGQGLGGDGSRRNAAVAGAPRPEAVRRYLDWLLTPPAQAEFARAYFRPVIDGAMPADVAANFLPASEYERVRNLSLADMAASSDALKRAWQERIRRGG